MSFSLRCPIRVFVFTKLFIHLKHPHLYSDFLQFDCHSNIKTTATLLEGIKPSYYYNVVLTSKTCANLWLSEVYEITHHWSPNKYCTEIPTDTSSMSEIMSKPSNHGCSSFGDNPGIFNNDKHTCKRQLEKLMLNKPLCCGSNQTYLLPGAGFRCQILPSSLFPMSVTSIFKKSIRGKWRN